MSSTKSIAVVCGGYTGEKAISMKSAEMVMNNIDRTRYAPTLVRIDNEGWVAIVDDREIPIDKNDFSVPAPSGRITFDAAFVAIHGTPGEDGKLQGYFDMIDMPYNTGGVLNMSLTFDKYNTVSILRSMGFQVADSVVLKEGLDYDKSEIIERLGLPCFVKPTNAGSSLGITKVKSESEFETALTSAFAYGEHVMVEALLSGTEITCGVLKIDGKTTALQITEIVSYNEFFDYDAKYNEASREEITPARIPDEIFEKCLRLSERIFDFLDCDGFARVDYMLQGDDLYVIELNTVPGMSEVSLLPQQCEVYGLSKKEMITKILENCLRA